MPIEAGRSCASNGTLGRYTLSAPIWIHTSPLSVVKRALRPGYLRMPTTTTEVTSGSSAPVPLPGAAAGAAASTSGDGSAGAECSGATDDVIAEGVSGGGDARS